ncbi:efflux transporter outer membrane subunit [Comamonas thiooxydans]|uniref:efflux transporter outer membrane subunit n=1 Tax=Comamonas thiooxydans TaxID=363952 RepID=UPI00070C51CE|nr:efflux transporter outer membrane subunit [Comamonas thiooxydans]
MNGRNTMRTATLTLIAAMLAGCSFAPTYERPAAPIPGNWSAASSASAASMQSLHWKDFVIDERLRSRIETALANNRDLRQTLLNVQTARAAYRVQRADQLPGLEAQASGNRQRLPADLSGTGAARVQSNYQAGAGLMAFELDLFGRVSSLSEAALMEYLATEEAARSVQISLVAEVIQASLAQDSARQRQALALCTLQAREKELQLMSERRKTGMASRLDEQEAQGQLEQARAEVERFERELRQAGNALDWLVGDGRVQPAADLSATPLVQEIGPGLSSDLLVLRPDIRSAEYQLRARNASIGAARAAFFPRISLTGSYGSASSELSDLFAGGQRSWSFMPQLSLPIFDGGRNRANLEIAQLRKDMAVASYERSIQTAFREVSDALASVETLRREELARQRLVQTSANTLKLAELRYRAGVDSHLRYLDAQRTDYAQQMALIEVSAQRQMALATLFKALGGGWQASPGAQG